jgi:hypothetical protein
MTNPRHEPLYDVHPVTGASIEVFFVDRALETFGRCGAGWFWWSRRRGFPPEGAASGPFPTSDAAYRHATKTAAPFPPSVCPGIHCSNAPAPPPTDAPTYGPLGDLFLSALCGENDSAKHSRAGITATGNARFVDGIRNGFVPLPHVA